MHNKHTVNESQNTVAHKGNLYTYTHGYNGNVLIKETDGKSYLIDRKHIKGMARPNLLKRMISFGKTNIKLKHGEIEHWIKTEL